MIRRRLFIMLVVAGVSLFSSHLRAQWINLQLPKAAVTNTIVFDPYLLVIAEGSIYRSSDDGDSWEQIGSGLPTAADPHGLYVFKNRLFLTMGFEDIHTSFDTGVTWQACRDSAIRSFDGSAGAIGSIGDTLFIGTGSGYRYSTDEGSSWVWPQVFSGDTSFKHS